MRRRIQCRHLKDFGGSKNPCHKILCEVIADDIEEEDVNYTVKGLRELKLKCYGCKQLTVIKVKEGQD